MQESCRIAIYLHYNPTNRKMVSFESSHSDITVKFQMKRDPNRSPPICKAFSIQTFLQNILKVKKTVDFSF